MDKKKVSQLKPFVASLLPAKVDDIIEFDELWSFIFSKANRFWLWIALCRRTKQVLAYHFGDRNTKTFDEFYLKVPIPYANCLSRSDGLKAYKKLTAYGHKMHKKKDGETNQVEAFNTILRQRISRLVRKSCAFSKSFEMHEAVIRCFIQEYNEKIYQFN